MDNQIKINMSNIKISDDVLKNIRASIADMPKIDTSQIPEIKLNNSTESSITIEKLFEVLKVFLELYVIYKYSDTISKTTKEAEIKRQKKRQQELEEAVKHIVEEELKNYNLPNVNQNGLTPQEKANFALNALKMICAVIIAYCGAQVFDDAFVSMFNHTTVNNITNNYFVDTIPSAQAVELPNVNIDNTAGNNPDSDNQ